jgi:hypothetical protein
MVSKDDSDEARSSRTVIKRPRAKDNTREGPEAGKRLRMHEVKAYCQQRGQRSSRKSLRMRRRSQE